MARGKILGRRRLALTICAGALVLAGAAVSATANGSSGASPVARIARSYPAVNDAEAVKGAKWASNVTVRASRNSVTISSNGLPSAEYWTLPKYYAVPNSREVVVPEEKTSHIQADPAVESPISITVPVKPKWRKKTTKTQGGPIGIMLSGAPLFDPYEGDGQTVALEHNFYLTGPEGEKVWFIDECFGHPSPTGAYHYHGMPTCITEKVDGDGPSHMIGVALDGFPIYGDRNVEGKTVKVVELDECNGIYSPTPEFPDGIYHYVLTDEPSARSSIGCYHGRVSSKMAAFAKALLYHCLSNPGHHSADPVPGTREVHTYSWLTGARTLYVPKG